ncbi:hypothetical protein E2562_033572, partial [Oryza meyeriana var. granulata]
STGFCTSSYSDRSTVRFTNSYARHYSSSYTDLYLHVRLHTGYPDYLASFHDRHRFTDLSLNPILLRLCHHRQCTSPLPCWRLGRPHAWLPATAPTRAPAGDPHSLFLPGTLVALGEPSRATYLAAFRTPEAPYMVVTTTSDKFYHCSEHQFVYTHASTGLHLSTTRDDAR